MKATFFDIETRIHPSFWILAVIFIYQMPHTFNGFMSGVCLSLVVLASVIIHEFAHALTARAYGYETKDIVMYFFGGIASIKGIGKLKPAEELAISIAGPASNAVLFIIGSIAIMFTMPQVADTFLEAPIKTFLGYFCMVNLALGLFNMIPAYPMDGGRVMKSFLAMFFGEQKATRFSHGLASVLSFGMILIGLFTFSIGLVLIGLLIQLFLSQEKKGLVS